eukprot:6459222-Amphidinium_carterae.2
MRAFNAPATSTSLSSQEASVHKVSAPHRSACTQEHLIHYQRSATMKPPLTPSWMDDETKHDVTSEQGSQHDRPASTPHGYTREQRCLRYPDPHDDPPQQGNSSRLA